MRKLLLILVALMQFSRIELCLVDESAAVKIEIGVLDSKGMPCITLTLIELGLW